VRVKLIVLDSLNNHNIKIGRTNVIKMIKRRILV
jgi:hypothetical protein